MTIYRRRSKHIILATALVAFILFTSEAHSTTTVAIAEFNPPNTATWLGSGETSGIFSSGKVVYNITNGAQLNPTIPEITIRSNTSQIVKLGNCLADFRLLRVEENGSLTQIDYARFTLNIIVPTKTVFWASTILDYPSTYRLGVVIWNATDGSEVGRLTSTIQTSAETVVAITTDRAEYTRYDKIRYSMVNRGPPVTTMGELCVYRDVGGGWMSVTHQSPYLAIMLPVITVSKDRPFNGSFIDSSYIDLSQPGDYKVTIIYLPSLRGESGEASGVFRIDPSDIVPPPSVDDSHINDSLNWALVGALVGAVAGLALFFLVRMYPRKTVHKATYSYYGSIH